MVQTLAGLGAGDGTFQGKRVRSQGLLQEMVFVLIQKHSPDLFAFYYKGGGQVFITICGNRQESKKVIESAS